MPKKAPPQTVTSERGIALIAQIVGDMEHLWHPTAGTDSGIDGQIELRDPATHAVRNVRIGVQSKATTKRWPGETDHGFHFRATPDDIDYWLSSSQPVLLICSRPASGETYWRSIQEWARNDEGRHERKIDFNKERDRFDASVRDQLFNLRAPGTETVQPPGAATRPERLLTNLMPVRWEADRLYSAAASGINSRLLVPPVPAVRDGRIWSLRPLPHALIREARLTDLKAGSLEPFRTSSADSDLNLVRELMRRDLLVRHRDRLLWNEHREIAYFARGPNQWEPVTYAWSSARASGRAVVSPQEAKTREGFTGYRHDAAEFNIRRLEGEWFVQVKPTYLFTWDGVRVSGHHKDALSKIKRLDKHSTVSQMLRMWQQLLVGKLTLEPQEPQPYELGPLVECSTSRSIIDKTWQQLGGAEHTAELQSSFDLGEF
jgi:hypothetical protein